MTSLLPALRVRGPSGQEYTMELTQERVTIGRSADVNDITLDGDMVTRVAHCTLVYEDGARWLSDQSKNGTFIVRGGITEPVSERLPLEDRDVIRLPSRRGEGSENAFWELTFQDPFATRPAEYAPSVGRLEYDWARHKLYRTERGLRIEIRGIRAQGQRLIRYMVQRNREHGVTEVLCSHDELIRSVWGDEDLHTPGDIATLVREVREKVEPDPSRPHFLLVERGVGYRLDVR